MKLITETVQDTIIESRLDEKTGEKQWVIEGIYFQAETPNRNKRVYQEKTLDREFNRYNEIVEAGRAIGELNHPKYIEPDPARAVHRIVELKKDGTNYIGKSIINPRGEFGPQLIGLMETGYKCGVSTRGAGSLSESKKHKGIMEVADDYFLSCVDVVHNPSGIDCWVNGIMEGVELFWDGDKLVQRAEAAKKTINEGDVVAAFRRYFSK